MNLIKLAIAQPVTVAVGVILIILAGAISLTPNVEAMVIMVETMWEGASPDEVEKNIIDKQEERLLGLANLRSITSTSSQSQGSIRMEFATGTDKAEALREVSDKLREVPEYPENVDEPVIQATDRENRDYIAWIMFGTTDPSFDVRVLRDFAVDRIEPALERVPGIAEISVLGGREREVQVRVDPVRLAQYGVTPSQFASVIRQTNRNYSAGQVETGRRDVRLRTISQYASLEQIRETVVREDERGTIRVRDLAEVEQTYKEPTSFVRSKGNSVIAINAEREIDSNVIEVVAALRAEIDRLNAPDGVLKTEARRLGLNGTLELSIVYDQTVYIDDALALVRSNIWIGGGLAVIVLILFLRSLRSVGIIALAIPISVIGAVVAMVMLGRSINVISLAGMAFAVGMVVDNAIVVLENVFRHLEMGKKPFQAATDGAREVWGAVLASTLTTVAVFVPILLIQDEAGQLFRDIALAICAAVTLSLLVSITVIPTLGARILKAKKVDADTSRSAYAAHHKISNAIGELIYHICGSTIARLAIVIALTVASLAGTFYLMPPADYLPTGNRNLAFGMIFPPPGQNIGHYENIALRVEDSVRPFWEAGEVADDPRAYQQKLEQLPLIPVLGWDGQPQGPPITPPGIDNYFLVSFGGILFHGGVATEPRRASDMLPLFKHATRKDVLPDAISFPFQVPLFQQGGSTGSAVKLQLAGPDLDDIVTAATALQYRLGMDEQIGFSQVQADPSNFNLAAHEYQVRPDLVRLGELGLTPEDIGMAVRASGDGAIIDEYQLAGEAIDLKVISTEAVGGGSLDSLADLPIATPAGPIVPLSSVAEIRLVRSPAQIARVGRQRAVSFQVTPHPEQPLEALMERLDGIVDEMRSAGVIGPAIVTSMSGSASKLQSVKQALLGDGSLLGTLSSSLVLALVVVYLLMCVLFQSFLRPLVIMISVPLATLGGFAALSAVYYWSLSDRHMPVQMLDVLTMLGFVILIGVVVNNAILIVHQSLHFMRGEADSTTGDHATLAPRRAIADAVKTRVRPIFMSTLTSIGGMAPLVLMPGSGSELYRGLGSVVLGGLLVSTIFTIILVPLLLSLLTDLQMRLGLLRDVIVQQSPSAASQPVDDAVPSGAVAGATLRSSRA